MRGGGSVAGQDFGSGLVPDTPQRGCRRDGARHRQPAEFMEAGHREVEAGELVFPFGGTEASADANHKGSLSYLRTGGGSEGFPEGPVLLLLRGSSFPPVIVIHIVR